MARTIDIPLLRLAVKSRFSEQHLNFLVKPLCEELLKPLLGSMPSLQFSALALFNKSHSKRGF